MIKVLDHGFVKLIDHMGNDASIVQAARVSYGAGTKTIQEDTQLINYLMRHWHTTPFEMVEFKFHMKLPIFVARQLIRHRTASVNEYSMRYSEPKDEFYVPKTDRIKGKGKANKQGSEGEIPETIKAEFISSCSRLDGVISREYKYYAEQGVANELNRINQPVSAYTEWYWKMDLHNLFHFLRLRLDSHAQEEIREYAKAIFELIKPIVPAACAAFEEYRLGAITFSAKEIKMLRGALDCELFLGDKIADSEFSFGEWAEFQDKIRGIDNE